MSLTTAYKWTNSEAAMPDTIDLRKSEIPISKSKTNPNMNFGGTLNPGPGRAQPKKSGRT